MIGKDGALKLNVGDGSKEIRLGKQKQDLTQIILALQKIKDLICLRFSE